MVIAKEVNDASPNLIRVDRTYLATASGSLLSVLQSQLFLNSLKSAGSRTTVSIPTVSGIGSLQLKCFWDWGRQWQSHLHCVECQCSRLRHEVSRCCCWEPGLDQSRGSNSHYCRTQRGREGCYHWDTFQSVRR